MVYKAAVCLQMPKYQSASKVVIIGQTVVDNVFPDGQDPVGQMIRFNNIPFKVIGVLEEKGENTFGQDQDDVVIAPLYNSAKTYFGN